MTELLSQAEIDAKITELAGWSVVESHLQKRWQFKGQSLPLLFAQEVWKLANEQNHHPEVTFGWGYAKIAITTHDANGLTERDFKLAEAIDEISKLK